MNLFKCAFEEITFSKKKKFIFGIKVMEKMIGYKVQISYKRMNLLVYLSTFLLYLR